MYSTSFFSKLLNFRNTTYIHERLCILSKFPYALQNSTFSSKLRILLKNLHLPWTQHPFSSNFAPSSIHIILLKNQHLPQKSSSSSNSIIVSQKCAPPSILIFFLQTLHCPQYYSSTIKDSSSSSILTIFLKTQLPHLPHT